MAIAGLYKIFDHWHQEGTVWICSDPHFGDADLEAGIRNRPSAAEIVQRINAKCGRKDTLICLGDVGDVEYVKLLRAKRKILVCGNHDAGRTNYERKTESVLFDKHRYTKEAALQEMKILFPNCRYSIDEGYQFHSPFEYWKITADNCLFDEVYEGPLMIAEKLILSHEPIDVPWAFNIHGHDHTGRQRKGALNVCLDGLGYNVMNLNQALKNGLLSKIESIHRDTIDKAAERKKKRGGKKIGEK